MIDSDLFCPSVLDIPQMLDSLYQSSKSMVCTLYFYGTTFVFYGVVEELALGSVPCILIFVFNLENFKILEYLK